MDFINGVLVASGVTTDAIVTNSNALIFGEDFYGIMDELRVTNFVKTGFGGGVVIDKEKFSGDGDEHIRLYNNADTDWIPEFSDSVIPVVFVAALLVVVGKRRKKLLNEK